jgi:hypothetical protein
MKQMTFLLAAGWLALGVASAAAQASPQKSTDSPEVEYLRRLIAEQQKNPGKVIRSLPTNAPVTPSAATNRATPESAKAATPPKTDTPVRARESTNVIPSPDEAARQKKISEVETRLDEMLKLKEAREKTALTNAAATNNISATPQTKRQRLDALLKQMIDGKITGAEYNEKRAKIVEEPD